MADDYAASTATTGTVAIGGTTTGSIETANDVDWFKVTLTAGKTYRFEMRGADSGDGTLADPFLSIRDSSGTILASSDDGDVNLNSDLLFKAPNSDTYYLSADAALAGQTGTYRITAVEMSANQVLPTLTIAPSSTPAAEGNSGSTVFTFLVTRTGDLSSASSASWAVTGNGAQPANGADFIGSSLPSGTVSFAPGQATASITINVAGDTTLEPDEGFLVSLLNPVGASLGSSEPGTSISQSASGRSGVSESLYTLVAGGGTLTLNYDMLSLPDRADIYVNGTLAVNTNGAVTGAGTLTVPPNVTLNAGDTIRVVMTGGDLDTAWDYTLNYSGGIQALNYLVAGTITNDDQAAPPPVAYTVAGTLGNDVLIPTAGNRYLGGAGNDTYVVSPSTLSGTVTASITDTEGSNVVQMVDGTTVSASSFFADAVELTLSSGSKLQVLGASKFSFQLGANATSGDAASSLSYAQFASALGATLPTGSTPTSGSAGFVVPTTFTQAAAPTPAVVGTSYTVAGTLGNDVLVPSAGNRHLGGAGNDRYLISPQVLAGPVTASIIDTEGSDAVQLADGMTVVSSSFFNDAVQLVLSTGASVQILGASRLSFQVGANAPAADGAASLSYAQFGALLGVTIPAPGAQAVSGTPNFVVPTGSGAVGGGGGGAGIAGLAAGAEIASSSPVIQLVGLADDASTGGGDASW